jgi:hypothetical protein
VISLICGVAILACVAKLYRREERKQQRYVPIIVVPIIVLRHDGDTTCTELAGHTPTD